MSGTRPTLLLFAVLMTVLSGCSWLGLTSSRKRLDGYIVRDVKFDGNGNLITGTLAGQSDYILRKQVASKASPSLILTWPFSLFRIPEPYRPELLESDAYRLEVWYAHNGWFDAKFQGWRIREVRPQTKRKAGVVDILGRVEPGLRSNVRSFDIDGLGTSTKLLGDVVRRTGDLRVGEPYVLDYAYSTRDLLLRQLQEHGHAYAAVEMTADAYPVERAVDVHFKATPGIRTKFGPIEVVGNSKVSKEVILDEILIESGDLYKISKLEQGQRRLFALGTFSVVGVKPILTDPTVVDVPIRVQVQESKFQTVRFGTGVDYDGLSVTPRLTTAYRHVHLFNQLVRLDAKAELGWSVGLSGEGFSGGIPVFNTELGVSTPRMFGNRRFGLGLTGSFERELLDSQFPVWKPRVELTINWRPINEVVVSFGPRWQMTSFDNLEGTALLLAQAAYGEGFVNPYRLWTFGAGVTVDRLNDPRSPTRGYNATFGIKQAIPVTPTDFFYTEFSVNYRIFSPVRLSKALERPDGKARFFRSAVRALAPEGVAARMYAKVLQPWDQRPIPYNERGFLGGSDALRGFFSNRVGDYDCLCLYTPSSKGDPFTGKPGQGYDVERTYLPRGGAISALVSGEMKYEVYEKVAAVLFFDGGLLAESWDTLSAKSLRFGAGVGARYSTGLGPFRVDLAFRPLYPEDAGPVNYVNCDSEDRLPRSYDAFSYSRGARDITERKVPFAMNFYIAIGEAI